MPLPEQQFYCNFSFSHTPRKKKRRDSTKGGTSNYRHKHIMQANTAGIGIRQILKSCSLGYCKVLITCLTFEKDHIFENKMCVSQPNLYNLKRDAICKHHKTTNKYVDISAFQFQIDGPLRFWELGYWILLHFQMDSNPKYPFPPGIISGYTG